MARPVTLFTIGYERADVADFIATLEGAGVRTVIDVREAPVSRRRDYAKNRLADHLESAGIAYVHLRGLGTPKPGRDAAKAGDRETFWQVFSAHMEGEDFAGDLTRAEEMVKAGGACLLCLERDPDVCHRSVVAGRLGERLPLEVEHLRAPTGGLSGPKHGG